MKDEKRKRNIRVIIVVICLVVFALLCPIIFKNRNFEVKMKNVILKVGDNYEDNFSATFKGKDVTDKVKVAHNIYNEKIGKYQITFTYNTDDKEYEVIKYVEIKDDVKPVITLSKGSEVIVLTNENYIEPGFKVIDNYDGDITGKINITNNIDTSKVGIYEIKYSVIDSSRNKATSVRKVNVVDVLPIDMSVKEFKLDGLFSDSLLKETESDSNYSKDFIFIGDSILNDFSKNKIIDGERLWNRSGMEVDAFLTSSIYINEIDTNKTLLQNLEEIKPSKVIITLGTDSVGNMEINKFISNYKKLINDIKTVSGDSLVIIQSIPPVSSDIDNKNGNLNNDTINKFNYYILEMCNELNVAFLNSAEVLKDNDGKLKKDYYMNDGIHLSKKAMEVMIKYFENHVYVK